MKRKIVKSLTEWKLSPKRKPLVLLGARQVGKTTILKQFGKDAYENLIYLNFEESPELRLLFEKSLQPKKLLEAMSIETNTKIVPEKTLIILDEVQECPSALNSLKYFCESAKEYPICAAGSLLGVKLKNQKGFPVGKVNFLEMNPMSFLEFLEANNEILLKNYVEDLSAVEPLPPILHEKLIEYLKYYFYVGGMPEAVAEYIQSHDLNQVRNIQKDILLAYHLDFAKHAPPEILMKINQVWGAVPHQLGKENKKFIFSAIRKGARARDFETAVQWLLEAGLLHKVCNISTPKLPLDAYAEKDFFKLYLLDVGLLGAMSDLSAKVLLQNGALFQEFKGSLTENYVMQAMNEEQFGHYYWSSEGTAELDGVLNYESEIFPLEIKSGFTGKKKSLNVYVEKYKPRFAIRTSPMNLKKDGNILNCPLYLVGVLKKILSLL